MVSSSIRAKLNQHIIAVKALKYRTISDGAFELKSDWVRGFSGLEEPQFNVFQPLTFAGLDDEVLADTAAFFSSKNVRYVVELVHDWLPNGPDYLDKRRYQSLPPQPAMFLDNSSENSGMQLNPAVSIRRVNTVPALTAFCVMLNQVFDYDLTDIIKFSPVTHLKESLQKIIYHYLAFLDDQPVGAGTVICLEDVASIGNICTVDQYRNRGVATTLLHRMLNDARTHHCSSIVLYTTPHAYHLFNKFDFEIITQRQWFLPPGIDYQDI